MPMLQVLQPSKLIQFRGSCKRCAFQLKHCEKYIISSRLLIYFHFSFYNCTSYLTTYLIHFSFEIRTAETCTSVFISRFFFSFFCQRNTKDVLMYCLIYLIYVTILYIHFNYLSMRVEMDLLLGLESQTECLAHLDR